jgi:hypothetical protein
MKPLKTILLAITCIITLATSATFAQKKGSTVYAYPVKSAHIEYTYSGTTTGPESWYMDNYGKLSARYSEQTTKSFGSTTKTKQTVIQHDSVFYTIDELARTGVKMTIHIDPKDVEKWTKSAEQAWTDSGFKKTGEGVILDKKCEIWEGMNTKIWVWQNFALKTEMSLFGKTVIEATKIEVGGSVDKSKFAIPADIKFTESNFSTSDPVFDSIGKNIDKGLKDLKDMFGPKKKK